MGLCARGRDHLRGRLPAGEQRRPIRPVAVLASGELAAARPLPPRRDLAPGDGPWSLGTGIPLLGILVLATSGLVDSSQDRTLLAAAIGVLAVIGIGVGSFAISVASRSVADPIAAVRRAMAPSRRATRGPGDRRRRQRDGCRGGLQRDGRRPEGAERMRDLFGRHVGREVGRGGARARRRRGAGRRGARGRRRLRRRDRVHKLAVRAATRTSRHAAEPVLRDRRRGGRGHGGWVNKFEGDAALCVFGAPTGARMPPATRCGRARPRPAPAAELDGAGGIGVSAGPAVAGNVGAEQRFEYTVIGDPSTRRRGSASWPSGAPSRCWPRRPCCAAPTPEEADRWELRDSVVLRGREQETRVAAPLRLRVAAG